MKDKLVSKG